MIRLLHLSDVHLGATLSDFGGKADARRQELLDGFRGLPQLAEAARVQAVLIAGDLFDSPRPSEFTLAVARQTIRHLVDAGRAVFLVPGAHDTVSCNPDLYADHFGGAIVFRHPTFQAPASVDTAGGPLHVYGLAYDWAYPEPLATFQRSRAPGLHVVMMHGATPSLPEWRAHPDVLRVPTEWLSAVEADYVALGGCHGFRAPSALGCQTEPRACYSGSFAAVHLTETGPRGYVIVELEEGEAPRIVHYPSHVRHAVDLGAIDVAPYPDEAAIADAIAGRLAEEAFPVVRLEGEPARALSVEKIVEQLERELGAAKVTDATWFSGSKRLDELAEQDTIAGHVVRLGRQRILEAIGDPAAPVTEERALRLALRALRAGT